MDPLITAALASRMSERIAEADAWRARTDRPRRRRRRPAPSVPVIQETQPCPQLT